MPYVETQKAVNRPKHPGGLCPWLSILTPDLYDVTFGQQPAHGSATHRISIMISTNGGTTYDILYITDQNSGNARRHQQVFMMVDLAKLLDCQRFVHQRNRR